MWHESWAMSDMDMNKDDEQAENKASLPSSNPLIVVGIGASAGGLEALQLLVSTLPKSSGLCYVLAQHLSPS